MTPPVPQRFADFAFEWREGYRYGLTDTKGSIKVPKMTGSFSGFRRQAWRNGRDEAMKARGLIKKSKLEYEDTPRKRGEHKPFSEIPDPPHRSVARRSR